MNTTIFITGNCQAQYLASAFTSLDGFDTIAAGRRYGFDPMIGDLKPYYIDPRRLETAIAEHKAAGRKIVLLEQVSPRAATRDVSELSPDVHVLFPHLQSAAFWPTKIDSRLHDIPSPRIYSMDLADMRRSQTKANFPVDVVAFIEAEFVRQPLFLTYNHPTGPLLGQVMQGILKQLDGVISEENGASLVSLVTNSPGINNINHHPIDVDRADSLGFEWHKSRVYELWLSASRSWKARELQRVIERADEGLLLEPTHAYLHNLRSHALQGLDRMIDAIEAARLASVSLPGSASMVRHHAALQMAAKLPMMAEQTLRFGLIRLPTETQLYTALSEALFMQNRKADALIALNDAVSRGRPDADSIIAGGRLLSRYQMIDESRALIEAAIAKHPKLEKLRQFQEEAIAA